MCNQGYEILIDRSKTGKERPWKTHKTSSSLLADSYYRIADKFPAPRWLSRAENVEGCGSSLKFNVCPNACEGTSKLKWANFCKIRLCPMCSWRRALVNAHNLKKVAHEAVKRKKIRWLFLTLTIKNCTSADLSKTINHLMASWNRFAGYAKFKKVVVGWYRAFEITRNQIDDTYHPHFHILIGVEPSYFYQTRNDYLTQEEWRDMWRKALKIDYDPTVDIRVVKKKRNVEKEMEILEDKGLEVKDGSLIESELSVSAVAELAKYATKSSDYLVYNRYKQKQDGDNIKRIPVLSSGIYEERQMK